VKEVRVHRSVAYCHQMMTQIFCASFNLFND